MISLNSKQKNTFNNEYSEKFFILFTEIGNMQRNYSHENLSIYDNLKNSWFNFIGSFINDISFEVSFKPETNSYNLPSTSLTLIDSEIDLISLAKNLSINFSEIQLYFITDELFIDESLPLFKGIIGIDTIDTSENPFSISFVNTDNKYDAIFPPYILGVNVSGYSPANDAEKYNGESVPVVYGYPKGLGFPVPIYSDDGSTTVKYIICSHDCGTGLNFFLLADGIVVPSANYTRYYDAILGFYFVQMTYANYTTYCKGKKVTCYCAGLLYDYTNVKNPSIGEVVLHILENYSNLESSDINSQAIATAIAYLSSYQVARFFNASTTAFDVIKELGIEFPFIFNDSGIKKSITCVDPNFTPYTFELLKYKHWIERNKGIKITKASDTYNKFIAKYIFDALNNRWQGNSTIDYTNNNDCKVLKSKIGNIDKEKEILELYSVDDLSTVNNILLWQVKLYAIQRFTITYKCKHNCIILELGDGVLLTDEELGIARKKFMVIGKLIKRDFIYITIQNVENL